MNQLFEPLLRKLVIIFFEDILVYSAMRDGHLAHLTQVFTSLVRNNSFYVRERKCLFGLVELFYLGHIISPLG